MNAIIQAQPRAHLEEFDPDAETAAVLLPSGLYVELAYTVDWHSEFDYYSNGDVSWPDVEYTVQRVTGDECRPVLAKLRTEDYRAITRLLTAAVERQEQKKYEDY